MYPILVARSSIREPGRDNGGAIDVQFCGRCPATTGEAVAPSLRSRQMSIRKPVKPPLLTAYGMAALCAVLPLSVAQAQQASSNTSWVPICIGSSPCAWVEVLVGDAYPDGAVCTSDVQCASESCFAGRCLRSAGRLCESSSQCASALCLLDPSPGYCAEHGASTCSHDSDCDGGTCNRGHCIAVAVPDRAVSSNPNSVGDISYAPAQGPPDHPTPRQLGYVSAEDIADDLVNSGESFAPIRLIDGRP